jgi:hypothetical protein
MIKARWGLLLVLCAGLAHAQSDPAPTNDLPNPFKTTAPWGTLPEGRTWGTLSAVAIDHDGASVWVAYRCGTNPNTPVGDSESNRVVPHPGWKQGIRIGDLDTGKVRWFIPADETKRPGPEGTAVDAKGNIHGAEVGQIARHSQP